MEIRVTLWTCVALEVLYFFCTQLIMHVIWTSLLYTFKCIQLFLNIPLGGKYDLLSAL